MTLSTLLLACVGPVDEPVDSLVPDSSEDSAQDTEEPSCGTALFTSEAGTLDLTEALSTGTAVALEEDGTLHLCRGLWFGFLAIRARVVIEGEGAESTVLSGGETATILQVSGEGNRLEVRDLSLDRGAAPAEDGNSGSGGALRCLEGSEVLIERAVISNNTGYDGAGVFGRDGCDVEVHETDFLNNRSLDDGGAFRVNRGRATLVDTRFIGNAAKDGGGLIFHESEVLVEGCHFEDNFSTDSQGGAILQYFGPLTVRDTTFVANHSLVWGGALSLFGDTVLEGVRFEGNASGEGGAVMLYTDHGTLSCVDCEFLGNSPDDVRLYEGPGYAFEPGGSFFCDATGCG